MNVDTKSHILGERYQTSPQPEAVEVWLTVVFVAVLDLALTYYGLSLGFEELNPIGQVGMALLGPWSLVGAKGVAIAVGVVTWGLLHRKRYLIPAVFILVWGTAALTNVGLIIAGIL